MKSFNTRMAHIVSILAMALLVASCNGTPVKFDQPSGGRYDMSRGSTVSAKACGFQLLLFIPIVTNDRAAIAYNSLKSKAGNGYLTDISVKESWLYAFVGTLYCTAMEGTVYPAIQS
jgi:hypothetical protein